MKEKTLETAMQIINNRRYKAEQECLNKKETAFKNPEFKNAYVSYTTKMIDCAKAGEKFDEKKEKEKVLILAKKLNLNDFSFEPQYYCTKCNDTGIVNGKYCSCLITELNKILIDESGFVKLEKFEDANFSIFDNSELMKKIYQKMKEWCHSDFAKTLIFISGGTGVGKTHLTKCMANELISRGKIVRLTTSFAMNQDFYKSYTSFDVEERDALIEKYLNTEILFIDDLGTELRNKATTNYLYLILNERKMKRLPTIITTNMKIDEIKDYYDERICSRIVDKDTSILLYIDNRDLRLNIDKMGKINKNTAKNQ